MYRKNIYVCVRVYYYIFCADTIPGIFTFKSRGERIANLSDSGMRVEMHITVGEVCSRPYTGINRYVNHHCTPTLIFYFSSYFPLFLSPSFFILSFHFLLLMLHTHHHREKKTCTSDTHTVTHTKLHTDSRNDTTLQKNIVKRILHSLVNYLFHIFFTLLYTRYLYCVQNVVSQFTLILPPASYLFTLAWWPFVAPFHINSMLFTIQA